MESSITKSGIFVALDNAKLWNKFYPQTEMIVTKRSGRCIFPHLVYKINGLQQEELYQIFISLQRMDNIKYKYEKSEFVEAAKGDRPLPIVQKEHPDGARPGSHWMKDTVSFSHIKITNDIDHENKKLFVVQSMHKFRPVLLIKKVGDSEGVDFSFQLTEFYAVTAYQSEKMINLKISHNKFASGFRSNGGKRKPSDEDSKSKRHSISPGSSSSTPSLSPPVSSPPTDPWISSFSSNSVPFSSPPNGAPAQFPTPQYYYDVTAAAAAAASQFPYCYYPGAQMAWNAQNMGEWMVDNGVKPTKVENPFTLQKLP